MRKNLFFLFIVGLFIACSKDTEKELSSLGSMNPSWRPGMVITDKEGWTEVIVGDMPLVISVPHGGSLKPEHIPDRECSGSTTVQDRWTIELAEAIRNEYKTKLNKVPFVIISHLARTKIDQNRALEEALCDDKALAPTWHFYHNYLDSMLNYTSAKYGKVFFIDLHAHGHGIQRLELGYNLSVRDLENLAQGWDLRKISAASSYANLFLMDRTVEVQEALTGQYALGTLMHDRGFASVPSQQDLFPRNGEPYFTGGFNTRFATASKYSKVYGLQIEVNSQARNTPERRAEFAKSLVESLGVMMSHF